MSRNRILKSGIVFIGVCSIFFFWGDYRETFAWECRLVRIHSGPGASVSDVVLEPETLWIDKGTCVVWVNQARTTRPELIIKFREDQKCHEVTEAATGFSNVEGCYVTGVLAYGSTSSLRFNEAGTFSYQLEAGERVKAVGKLIVR